MEINAWAAKGPKQSLTQFSYKKDIGENDVLVQIQYCSLLKADTFFIDNFWGDTRYQLVPSSEMFGIVVQKGNRVQNVNIGDYVGISYQVYSCLKCSYCKKGKEQFCKEQKLIGIHEYGGLAKHIIVNANFVYHIPLKLRKPEYVSLMGYGLTAFSAIRHANLKPSMNVGVIGVGNLGHLAAQILVQQEYIVTAFTHSEHKMSQLKEFGITHFVNPLDDKKLEKNNGKYDFLMVTTYHSYNWSKFIELLRPEGNLCFVGLPNENISFPATLLADYARRTVSGSYIGSRKDMNELLAFAEQKNIKAITQTFSTSEIDTVISRLRNNEIPFNAVIRVS